MDESGEVALLDPTLNPFAWSIPAFFVAVVGLGPGFNSYGINFVWVGGIEGKCLPGLNRRAFLARRP